MKRSRLLRNIRLGVKDVLRHKLRSFLTLLGVVFGVGSVIAMLAVGEGASREALEQIRRLGSQNILLHSVKPQEDEVSGTMARMIVYGLTVDDELRIRDSLPAARRTVGVRILRRTAYAGDRMMEVRLVGTTADWFDLVPRPVLAGRTLLARDHAPDASVCVLSEDVARRLLAGDRVLGRWIRVGTETFQVVGVVRAESGAGGIQTPDTAADVYIPLDALDRRYGRVSARLTAGALEMERVERHQILVEVDRIEHVEPAAEAIRAMIRRFHPRDDVRIHIPLALLRQAEATRRTFNVVLGSIAGISLLVGGIGIMNIMLAAVTERTREIGIRRAIGARRRQIVSQFLIETIVLSGAGGILGIGLGLGIPALITRFSGMPTLVPAYGIALSFGISVAIGIGFGLYPALRAASLDPIEALRRE